jgi:muramidase (phage lysozyme)
MTTNMQAFLRAVRFGEGTSDDLGYYRLCGGGEMPTLDRHPAYDGFKIYIPRLDVYSTAAGAYQINLPTWESLGFHRDSPFQPYDQDIAAMMLINRKGALDLIEDGLIKAAVNKCRKVWASLPGAGYGQREEKLSAVLSEFEKWGGVSV